MINLACVVTQSSEVVIGLELEHENASWPSLALQQRLGTKLSLNFKQLITRNNSDFPEWNI